MAIFGGNQRLGSPVDKSRNFEEKKLFRRMLRKSLPQRRPEFRTRLTEEILISSDLKFGVLRVLQSWKKKGFSGFCRTQKISDSLPNISPFSPNAYKFHKSLQKISRFTKFDKMFTKAYKICYFLSFK